MELPESQLVWLTKEQLDELSPGLGGERGGTEQSSSTTPETDPATGDRTTGDPATSDPATGEPPTGDTASESTAASAGGRSTADASLPLPPTLDPTRAVRPSFGLGGIIDPVDLANQIGEIRESLSSKLGEDVAEALLPSTAAGNPRNNHASLQALLTDINNSVEQALNGGERTTLRYERRFKGNTYRFNLEADFLPDHVRVRSGTSRSSRSPTSPAPPWRRSAPAAGRC
ncbi:hypothetical protein [Saccharopolyspora gregorii]|uniref:hypothetical protein n=1 Tax=Saccharopolyspora gregorii TaxID=33914 RepID=UPI0031F1A5BD